MLLNQKIPVNYILNRIKVDLVIVLLVGVFTNIVATKFSQLLPEMPLTIPSFLGTAILFYFPLK